MFRCHLIGLLLGTILDFVFGRIYGIWNPFDSVKKLIKYLDRALLGDEIILLEPAKQRSLGMWLVMLVLVPVIAIITFFTMLCYEIATPVGVLFEAFATYLCIDAKYLYIGGRNIMDDFYGDGLKSMKGTYEALSGKTGSFEDEQMATKEAITYIANQASDAVISPIFVMLLFGPVGGFVYRTVDLIDSEIGHNTYRYKDFGYSIAKLNRIVDYLPGRFAGALSVFAAKHITPGVDGKNARFINLRDSYKSISAFAGALGIKLKDDTIGDDDKVAEAKDIRRALTLLASDFFLLQAILVIFLLIF